MDFQLPSHLAIPFTIIVVVLVHLMQARGEIITDQPYSVTSFPQLEELYLRSRNPDPVPKSQLSRTLKWKICQKIYSASIPHWYRFTVQAYELSVHPKDVEHKLMRDHRRIFDELFESGPPPRFPWQRQSYNYRNRSTLRKIFVAGNEYAENVFTCLVENFQYNIETEQMTIGDEIKQYYVSDIDYNVNERPGGEFTAGRFLFFHNDRNQIVIRALAEESGYPILSEAAERRYWQKRNDGHGPMLEAENDPVCKLNDSGRLRLCNSVLLNLQKHLPGNLQVEGGHCEKKSFLLHTTQLSTTMYDEWMIPCVWNLDTVAGVNISHHKCYVSRSYSNNEVFIFVESDPTHVTLSLIECRRKVSVVSDAPVRFRFDDVED